jgi:hypothetical protein
MGHGRHRRRTRGVRVKALDAVKALTEALGDDA